jgi:hypothetical protein
VFNTVVGQNLIRGQHKADTEEEGENGEDREKHSDRHDDASLGLSPKAKCRRPCQFTTAMGRIVIESTRAEGLTVLRPDPPHRLDERISVTPRIFKPSGRVAVMLGRSGTGSFSHEHYSSLPSKTLRAAMGCAVRATETHNVTKRSIFAW